MIDFDEPVGLVTVGVWPFISDDDRPYELMGRYRDRLASGSYVALSHGSVDEVTNDFEDMLSAISQSYDETNDPFANRGREQCAAFFDGLTILDPGVVHAPDWHPMEPVDIDDPVRPYLLAGVARKP